MNGIQTTDTSSLDKRNLQLTMTQKLVKMKKKLLIVIIVINILLHNNLIKQLQKNLLQD